MNNREQYLHRLGTPRTTLYTSKSFGYLLARRTGCRLARPLELQLLRVRIRGGVDGEVGIDALGGVQHEVRRAGDVSRGGAAKQRKRGLSTYGEVRRVSPHMH